METKKQTLTDIAIRKESIIAEIIENEGELSPELESALLEATFEQEGKVEAYVYVMKKLEHEAEFWKKEKDQAAAIQKRLENNAERMKNRLKGFMGAMKIKTLSGISTKLTITPMLDAVVISEGISPDEVSPEFTRTKIITDFDKKKISEALKKGDVIPWAYLEPSYGLRLTKRAQLEGKNDERKED